VENKKILILKNDRAGDFISSVRLISELKKNDNHLSIYLSPLNYNFKFLVSKCNYKKINYNLNIFDKFKIFIDIFRNNYDEIYILSPKNFYFFLPIFFRKIKFFAIVINGKKRNRPIFFLRRFIYKTSIIYRNKINKQNIIQSNLNLINRKSTFNSESLNLNKSDANYFQYITNNYLYFQFKKKFFEDLNWGIKEFQILISFLNSKYKTVVFSSDIEDNEYDKYFSNVFSSINFENNYNYEKKKEEHIIYLKKIDPKNLFLVIKNANKILGPHGLMTQISYLLNKKSINLFNFKINNVSQYHHEKISFSEWYSNMELKFIFLNNDIGKSLRKISKFI